jgi:hypothetical protein
LRWCRCCRWLAAGKNFVAAASPHDGATQPQQQQQGHPAGADAATTHISSPFKRHLHPASEYETPGYEHWSISLYKQQLQQQQEAAAAAEAAKASKKRPASALGGGSGGGGGGAFGGLGGKEAKKLAAELAAGSGGQWWYVPGIGDGEQQVRRVAHRMG